MTKIRPLIALGFLFFLGMALYLSLSFPKEAKVLPLLVLIPGVLVACGNLLWELKSSRSAQVLMERPADDRQKGRFYPIFLAALALPVLSWLFGITIGLPLFMFIYLRWVSGESWGIVIFSTILSWIILYPGFEILMRSNFEQGVLLGLIFP